MTFAMNSAQTPECISDSAVVSAADASDSAVDDGSPEKQSRRCNECLQVRPITHFRLRSADGERARLCNPCHRARERARLARGKPKRTARKLHATLAELNASRSRKRVVACCNAMLTGFGGLDGFAAAFRASVEAARPGSYRAIRLLQSTLAFVEVAGPMLQAEERQLAGVSDVELVRRILNESAAASADGSEAE